MLQSLHRSLSVHCWDWIIMWRAIRGREFAFGNVPTDVVSRWAAEDVARFDGFPEIQDAIGYAQGELSARRGNRGRPGLSPAA